MCGNFHIDLPIKNYTFTTLTKKTSQYFFTSISMKTYYTYGFNIHKDRIKHIMNLMKLYKR